MAKKYKSYEEFAEDQKRSFIAKLGRKLLTLTKKVASFFYPFAVEENVPRKMYMQSFYTSFWLILILAPLYYFFFRDNVSLERIINDIDNVTSLSKGYSYHLEHINTKRDINGLFFFIMGVFCIALFQAKINDIPPTFRNIGLKLALSMTSYMVFLPAGAIVIKIGKHLESDPQITPQNIVLLLIMALTYGFMSFQFTKFLFDFSAYTGWRQTIHSPWRASLSHDPFDKRFDPQHDRKSK